jgi:hypothetical protein
MDHSEVVRLKVVEKYILGELTADLREQFEEHYFDCPECAAEVKALATFAAASRMISEEDLVANAELRERAKQRRGWFSWLRPVIAAPAIVALAAIVVFESVVTIPALKRQRTPEQTVQVYESSFRVQGTTRGENTSTVTVHSNQSFGLDFDFTPAQSFENYKGMLVDPAGQAVLSFDIKGEEANKELHLVIPADKVHSGKYDLIFIGDGMMNASSKNDQVQHVSFVVQVQP